MTVADLVACELRRAGVRALFGVPGGGSNLDLIAAADRAGLPFVLTATETAAALAAAGQAEAAGSVGACLTTLGPGAASAVNGVACAFLDRAPMIVFTDSHPSATFEHQRIDHAALLGPVTKTSEPLTADGAPHVIARAIATATRGRPGPVHLDCPGDVAGADASPSERASSAPPEAQSVDPDRLEGLLRASKKPLLIVGLGARLEADAAAIRSLCERRRVPALVTYKAKGVVPDDHPWFAGVFTNAAIEQAVIDGSDLLIGIGLDPVELIPRPWKHRQPIIYCGRWRVEDAHVPFAVQVIGDVAESVRSIENGLTATAWDPAGVRQHVADQRRRLFVAGGALTAQAVVEIAASRLAPIAGRVTVDAGAHMFPATMLWPVRHPNGMLISNGLSTMGFALPAAIGAAIVDRDQPVVALTGDGGLLMCVGELLTAAREGLRVITIVFSDASLSLIAIKQEARGLPASGVALGGIDWPALAASFGVAAWSARDAGELDRAIDRALQCDGPSLIEAKIDPANYGATLRAVRG